MPSVLAPSETPAVLEEARSKIASKVRDGLVTVALGGQHEIGAAAINFFRNTVEQWTHRKGLSLRLSPETQTAAILSHARGIGASAEANTRLLVDVYSTGLLEAIEELDEMGVPSKWLRGLVAHMPHHARKIGIAPLAAAEHDDDL